MSDLTWRRPNQDTDSKAAKALFLPAAAPYIHIHEIRRLHKQVYVGVPHREDALRSRRLRLPLTRAAFAPVQRMQIGVSDLSFSQSVPLTK